MNVFKINTRNYNLELISKLMNSVARKYNCRIQFDDHNHRMRFSGHERYQQSIVEETLQLFEHA